MADNAALIQEAYDGFARGDLSPLLGLFDENVEWFEVEQVTYWPGGPFKGAQATGSDVRSPNWRSNCHRADLSHDY